MQSDRVLYVISILAPDRPGIIADVSSAIYDLGGNFEAMSQTIMQGWFTMLLGASFPQQVTREEIERALGHFDAAVREAQSEKTCTLVAGEPYVLSAVGADRPGIVRRLSRCCADKGVNIEDVWNEVREDRFIMVFHVTVPHAVDPQDFRCDLERAGEALHVALTFQHQDIFTATNSLQVYSARRHGLLSESTRKNQRSKHDSD